MNVVPQSVSRYFRARSILTEVRALARFDSGFSPVDNLGAISCLDSGIDGGSRNADLKTPLYTRILESREGPPRQSRPSNGPFSLRSDWAESRHISRDSQ